MGLKGKIKDLPIFDVIQYLNAGGKTGTLIITHGQEKAFVYFQKGNIVNALSPHRMNLGDILLKNKLITLKDLKGALVLQIDNKKGTPIGQILVDMGVLPKEKLKEAVLSQINFTIGDLLKWNNGDFEFKINKIEGVDDINLKPTELILESDVNTLGLLMDAVVSMDQTPLGAEEGRERSQASPPPAAAGSGREKTSSTGFGETPPSGVKGFPAAGIDKEDPRENLGKGNQTLPGNPVHGEKRPPVFVFSEDSVFKNFLRTILRKNGLQVETPDTMEDCLSTLKTYNDAKEFPIVFIDDGTHTGDQGMHRPGMKVLSGKERAGWSFPVVILLNEMNQDEIWEFYNAGARAVLPKLARDTSEGEQFIRSIEKLGELILKKSQFLRKELARNGFSP